MGEWKKRLMTPSEKKRIQWLEIKNRIKEFGIGVGGWEKKTQQG